MPDQFKRLKEVSSKPQYRDFAIKPEDIDRENRRVRLSWASETPVSRWYGIEILDLNKKSVRMGRLQDGAAFLLNHDPDQQVGAVKEASIEKDSRGYAWVQVSRSRDDIWNDILDEIRTLVSVGYFVHEAVTESIKDGVETVRVVDWEPFELSLVGIPADETIGVGRSADIEVNTNEKDKQNMNRTMKILRAPDAPEGVAASGGGAPAPAEAARIDVVSERASARKDEAKRIQEIYAIGSRGKMTEAEVKEAVEKGTHADEFRRIAFERSHPNAVPVAAGAADLNLTENEKRDYSITRALRCLVNGREVDGYEGELSKEVAKRTRREAEGFFIPGDISRHSRKFTAREQRALSAEIAGAGGYTVATDVLGDSMIEILRNKTLVAGLGATNLTGLVGDIAIPRQNGAATAYWLGENDDTPESDQTFGQVQLRPRRLAAQTGYTKQLLAQSSIGVELFVRNDLMAILAIAKDLAAIAGTGAGGQPLGIINTNGVGSVTFGAPPTWPKIVSFETKLGQANADRGNRAWLTTPGTKGNLKTILKATVGASQANTFIWPDGSQVNGYPADDTNQVPGDQVIFGNFNDLILADWDGMDVVVDPYTLSGKGQVRITIHLLTDIALRHPQSFVVSSDSGAQ